LSIPLVLHQAINNVSYLSAYQKQQNDVLFLVQL